MDRKQDLDAGAADARIHTFLIADVRGYTLFTQERGDEAAAKLAARFAEIAREVVETRGGSLLELRGDEALCVFSSAREAIRAAVDLQQRFVEETIDQPELPLTVGIGLDAGEAVPVEEGYRGGALNLAARLCGQARAGEILASRGVTHLARKVDGVRYVDRGSLRLKNLSEPVQVVRILPESGDPAERLRSALPAAGPARRRSRGQIAIAAAVAVAVVIASAIVVLRRGEAPSIPAGAVGFIDAGGDLSGSAEVGELPRGVAHGEGALWVTDQQSGTLVRLDPATFKVDERIPVGAGPTGVTTAGGFVWVANTDDRTVSVIDPQAHRVVQTIVVGNGPAGIAALDGRVWVANSVDATVSEIDAAEGTVTEVHPVGDRPVAIAAGSGGVWVANERSGTISFVAPGEGETETIPVGRGPVAVSMGADALWVANAEDGTVSRVDLAIGAVTATERLGGSPVAISAAADGVWVANAEDGTVVRIDPGTGRASQVLEVGNAPRALVAIDDGAWVAVQANPATHRGGTLRIVSESGLATIDPNGPGGDELTAAVLTASYDGLVTFRRDGGAAGLTVVPDLAVALPAPTDDEATYAFKLRDGIRFSNGETLMPSDVAATFERILTSKRAYGRVLLPEIVGSSSCTPKDPTVCDLSRGVVADDAAGTVTIHLVRPAPDLLTILATQFFSIVPAGTPVDLGGSPAPATGPYVIAEIADDGSAVLERNPEFREWSVDAQPAGFADRIEVSVGVTPRAQIAAVEAGDADLGADGVPADLVGALERRASDQLVRSPFIAVGGITLNTAAEPFDEVDARRAVAYALDRGELARIFAEDLGIPLNDPVTCQVIPPNIPGYAPYCPFTRPGADVQGSWSGPDVTRARDLVRRSDTAGAEVIVAMSPSLEATAEHVEGTLDDLGYRAKVRIVDSRLGVIAPAEMPEDADVSFIGWAQDYPSAVQFLVPLLGCSEPDGSPAVKGAGVTQTLNLSNFCDPDIDRRVQEALDLKLTDPYASARAFEEIDHDLADLAPLVPISNGIHISLVSERVGNVRYNPQLGVLISQMWIR